MSVSTVVILSVVAVVVAALALAPPVAAPRAGTRATGRGRRRAEPGTGRHGRRRLRTVPQPRTGEYRRSAG
ncbi:hypothetical protein GCM10010336_25910 [Streptomyces goshikiensis]|nr:hypothetical protein EES37_32410 [Streptomyces sp. ADI91-18]GHD65574.1 hypothetical protein GCM10010336_25910 [Streptomyces goshikiensis]